MQAHRLTPIDIVDLWCIVIFIVRGTGTEARRRGSVAHGLGRRSVCPKSCEASEAAIRPPSRRNKPRARSASCAVSNRPWLTRISPKNPSAVVRPATHRRVARPDRDRDDGPASSWTRSPSVWTLGGADAPARRLRVALMSQHQGPMVSHAGPCGVVMDRRQATGLLNPSSFTNG